MLLPSVHLVMATSKSEERHLVSVDRLMRPALDETVRMLELEKSDAAVVRLAEAYASAIDNDGELRQMGPLLLACLNALRATPAARSKLKEGKPVASENQLQALRAARTG